MSNKEKIYRSALPSSPKSYREGTQPGEFDAFALRIDISVFGRALTPAEKKAEKEKCEGCILRNLCSGLDENKRNSGELVAKIELTERTHKDVWVEKMKDSGCNPQICF